MAETLLLRLPRAADEAASWLIVDGRGAPVGPPQSGPLNLAVPRVAGRRVCVLVPGAEVLLAEPDLPPKAGAKLAQLVPYALEEHLADSIEDLHFAIGKRSLETARVRVAVVARALLNEWLATLRAAGIVPDAMHADSDLLPQNPGQAVALMEADAVFVRAPGASPVTLPADALGQALEIAQSGTDTASGARGLILYTGAAEWQQHAAQVESVRAHFDGIKVQLLTGGPLALFAQQLPAGTAINLLQGEYAPESGRAIGWQAWRVAALLLAGLVALHLVGKATQLHFLKTREHQVDVSIREAVRAAMPGEPNLLDARKRMEQRLAVARGAGSGLLPALQALAQAGAVVPGTRLQSVNFKNGAVEMKLSAPDAASLDHLSQALRSNGWQADLLGGTNNGQGYEGRIQVHGNGG
jgi:general secretion pathway protein L